MNSYFFQFEIIKENQLIMIVESETLDRVAKVVISLTEQNLKTDTYADCTLRVNKCYVSSAFIVPLAEYKLKDLAAVKKLIMECK
jgi:hypothetical protein